MRSRRWARLGSAPAAALAGLLVVASVCFGLTGSAAAAPASADAGASGDQAAGGAPETAAAALEQLEVKGRAPKTGYSRAQFGRPWTDDNGAMWGHDQLSTREDILSRDLVDITCKIKAAHPPCIVTSGVLHDPYTGVTLNFVRGEKTSQLVPIDHIVSLGNAWQTGAQQLSVAERTNLANDPLNLFATTQGPNSDKKDSDAASYLIPRKAFRCTYVARQVAVKLRYHLWVTAPEKSAIASVLARCPGQALPTNVEAASRAE